MGTQNKAAAMQAERGDGPNSYLEDAPTHVGPRLICLPKTPWWAPGWTLLHPTCPLISTVGEHEIPRHRQGLTEDHHLRTMGFRWSPWLRPDQSTAFQLAQGGAGGFRDGHRGQSESEVGNDMLLAALEKDSSSFPRACQDATALLGVGA